LSIISDKVIVATQYPFYDGGGLYTARMYAERSYIIAAKSQIRFPGGMYISYEQPNRSLRFQPFENDGQLILIGGEHHKTGQDSYEKDHYSNLIKFAEETFSATDVPYRWSAQDYTAMDEIPYIGHITGKKHKIFIATAFAKWGMSSSAVAAIIIRDIIASGRSDWEYVFSPSRVTLAASAKNFFVENLNVVENLIDGKTKSLPKEFSLELGEGKAVKVDGKKAGAYRDMEGNIFIVDTTCKHLGCEVRWNSAEKTWDCPCHASRYSYDGTVIEGPALKPLERIRKAD